jgi:hypothetical protein
MSSAPSATQRLRQSLTPQLNPATLAEIQTRIAPAGGRPDGAQMTTVCQNSTQQSNPMKHITQNPAHIVATAQMRELTEAHKAAKLNESALLTQLNTQHASEKPSAIDLAKAMLTGAAPAQSQDTAGLHASLAVVNESLALLNEAMTEQRQATRDLVSAHGAVVNSKAKQGHLKAVNGIKTALAGLTQAMQAEQALRNEIEAAGYACSLESMAHPELNFNDTESVVTRFAQRVGDYLTLNALADEKSVTIRMLAGAQAGEVLTVTGQEAAARVRADQAEATSAKPSRTARPLDAVRGQSMATAFGA